MKNKNLERAYHIFLILVPIFLLTALWFIKAANGTLNTSVLPKPESVWKALLEQVRRGFLWKHIAASFSRVLKGYLIGVTAGTLTGIFAGLFVSVEKFITAPTGFLRACPAIALIPFFILWMGIGEASKVAIITFGTFWTVLIHTIDGIHATPSKFLEVSTVLCKNKLVVLRKIVLPSAVPSILTGLRLGMTSAWVCVVAAEMIAAQAGVGFLITYSREMANPATLFVGIAVIGIFGVIIDVVFTTLNKKLIYWQ